MIYTLNTGQQKTIWINFILLEISCVWLTSQEEKTQILTELIVWWDDIIFEHV